MAVVPVTTHADVRTGRSASGSHWLDVRSRRDGAMRMRHLVAAGSVVSAGLPLHHVIWFSFNHTNVFFAFFYRSISCICIVRRGCPKLGLDVGLVLEHALVGMDQPLLLSCILSSQVMKLTLHIFELIVAFLFRAEIEASETNKQRQLDRCCD